MGVWMYASSCWPRTVYARQAHVLACVCLQACFMQAHVQVSPLGASTFSLYLLNAWEAMPLHSPTFTLCVQMDVEFMRELGSLIPVVPLLAKADTLLPAELKVSVRSLIGSMSITVLQQTMGMRN